MIIAIDGPAAAGKGTLARRLAEHFGLELLDTGLLYRAVGLKTIRGGADPGDARAAVRAARALSPSDLEDTALRGEEAAQAASQVGAIGAVRAVMLDFQRTFAHTPPGAVIDGRDIGTEVCPDADVKIFVTARPEVRAERRLKELRARGVDAIHGRVLQDMKERDARDAKRDVAPLKPAEDAFVLDTGDLDADAAFAAALDFITSRNRRG
ncbi:MAG: (d)CMP kinase [Rhodospirillales bacterium]|nr:(d)CMP kinase [Rhodospirillales bacterium]